MESVGLEEDETLAAKGADGADGRAMLLHPVPLGDTSFRANNVWEVAEEERSEWRARDSSERGEIAWIECNAI